MPFNETWMDLEIFCHNDCSQRKTNTVYHLYVESKSVVQIDLLKKLANTKKKKKKVAKGERWQEG